MKYLPVLILLSLSKMTFSQEDKPIVKSGQPINRESLDCRGILNVEEGKIYIQGHGPEEVMLKRLDQANNSLEYNVRVTGEGRKWLGDFHYMKAHHGVVDVFYSEFDNERGTNQITYRRVNQEGQLSEAQIIDEFQTKGQNKVLAILGGVGNKAYTSVFSENSEKMLVIGYHDYTADATQKYTMAVYDWNYNLEWRSIHELPYTDKEFEIKDAVVTNGGEVVIMGTYNRNDQKGVTLFKFTEDGFQEHTLKHNVKSYVNPVLKADILGGKTQLFSWVNTDGKLGCEGYLMLTLDNRSFEVSNEILEDFEDKLLASLTPEARNWNKTRPFRDFEFKDVVKKSDGGFYVIAEKNYYEILETETVLGPTTIYTYFDLDLTVMSVDNSGAVEFLRLVPKFQKVKFKKNFLEQSSYAYLLDSDDRLHLFFNDHPDNLYFKPGGVGPTPMKNPEKSVAIQYIIDENGAGVKSQFKMNTKESIPEFRKAFSNGLSMWMLTQISRTDVQFTKLSMDR